MTVSNKNAITNEHLLQTLEITNIGIFIWNLQTDHVVYSKEWANIVGYDLSELEPHVSTWEKMLLPEDLKIAEDKLTRYLDGEAPLYEAEFRIVKKDGTIIWGHDKGKITEYDKNGKPLTLCGVLQDISAIKKAEEELRESTEILDVTIEVSKIGIWDWNIEKNHISYNDEFLDMFGFLRERTTGTLEEWKERNHPDDLERVEKELDDFLKGQISEYVVETRIRHAEGHYVWVRDAGRIVSRDAHGNPTRMIGGHVNIDALKKSQSKLELALQKLENHHEQLEIEIEKRTQELVEQDTLLIAVNEVSGKLLTISNHECFGSTVTKCIKILATAYNAPEIVLWKYTTNKNKKYIYMGYTYQDGKKLVFNMAKAQKYIESLPNDDPIITIMPDGNTVIRYDLFDKDLIKSLEKEENSVSDLLSSIPKSLKEFVVKNFKNTASMLISSVYMSNSLFGFISISSNKETLSYTEAEKNMLVIAGKLFANAQHRNEMEEELRQAHEEAVLSSKAKSNFLANMSHEIRTPLNAILGMSEIIVRESAGRTAEEYALEIKNASESLLTIINDILDISKIESGKLEIIELEYYITSLFNDVISLAKIRLTEKPVLFTTFIDSKIPAILYGDEIRIKQILLNLLGNAIKFTHKGNINFTATCEHTKGRAELTFTVEDTGMGINEEDMDKLFMQFERVDTKKNRNIEGTGLGLAIAKQLCEMMGGSISVESIKGKGSAFTVKIPQKYTENTQLVVAPNEKNILLYEARALYADSIKKSIENLGSKCTICTNQSELLTSLYEQEFDYLFVPTVHLAKIKTLKETLKGSFSIVLMTDPGDTIIYRDTIVVNLPINCLQLASAFGNEDTIIQSKSKTEHFIAPDINVLVVDDNQVNLKVAKGLMSPYKFNIDTAINGALGVEMVKNTAYDLVFMDHMMPEMDGIDATAEIRKLQGAYYQNLPIIALTANALVGAKELFVNEGMNDFLAKPIEMHKLHSILLKWIPKDKIQFVVQQAKNEKRESDCALHIAGIDTKKGLQSIGGSLEDYIDILLSFYSDGLKKLSTISDAFTNQDMDTYRIDVHAVKSASASIGAYDLSEQAKNLEHAATKEDMLYITAHTDEFLRSYTNLLDNLKEKLDLHVGDAAQSTEKGDISLLKNNITTLEEALEIFDIDIIEQMLESCMKFEWEGTINEQLRSIKTFADSFEYYNARAPLEIIKAELAKYYT